MTVQIDPKALAARLKEKQARAKAYDKYDITKKLADYEEATEVKRKADEVWREMREDINGYLGYLGEPLLPDDSAGLPKADLITKLEEVMPASFPNGANGKEIASAISLGVTTEHISALYWTEGQMTLKKAKDGTGKILTGLKTRYLLATDTDLDQINKDKATETADRETKKRK
jgi:hypothetical protein